MVGELFFKKIRIAKLGLGFLKKKAGVKLGTNTKNQYIHIPRSMWSSSTSLQQGV